ncbi:MAG: 1-acyl-sn-glycerol-3-phosphate acyltransferase [Bacteroidetes bacterium]|nr:1-acyl-sn-glycerol-3-phosphate acyltransferase [Bacteroidota bacterium]
MFLLRILKTLFGIYALLWFVILLLLAAPFAIFALTVFHGKKRTMIAHRIARMWATSLRIFLFLPLTVRNKNFIDPKKTYVFIANHQSQLDIPVYISSCGNTFRFLAKAELIKIPIFGYVVKSLYVTVNRTERADRNKSIEIMRRSLNEGVSVFLCPEGTRNRKKDPPLLEFRDGAFRLAIATQTPLAILTVLNTDDKLSPNHAVELSPGRIHAVWDPPIETKGLKEEDIPALKEKVRAMMIGHICKWRK